LWVATSPGIGLNLPATADMTISWINLTPEKASAAAAYGVDGTNQADGMGAEITVTP
jgi:hypothetical protein